MEEKEEKKLERCFIAIDLPREAINSIKDIQKLLKKQSLFNGKFTETENLHLTLKFLGEIDEEKIGGIKKKLREIKFDEFLQFGFNKLSTEDKLKWLETVIKDVKAKPLDFGMLLFGRGGLAISALFQAYRDADNKVRGLVKQVLKEFFLAEPSGLVTPDKAEVYI